MRNRKTDVVVVGSGIAGTLFSLELVKRNPHTNIIIICKKNKNVSSSFLAQGGIAAVLPDKEDSIEQHVKDTIIAGAYANDPGAVKFFVSKSHEAILALQSWGVCFDRSCSNTYNLALEGGHSFPRVLHHRDFTGKHIMKQLIAQLKKYKRIQLLEDVEVFDLISANIPYSVRGVHAWDYKNQQTLSIQSSAVVLSTGGVGSLFKYSTNPSTALGQGIALASKVGASIKDIINIQFHPTALYQQTGQRLPLITEALRGAGAVLRNKAGLRFMEGLHPFKELASRDIVARAIFREIDSQDIPYVYLDCTSIGKAEWQKHFPEIFKACSSMHLNPHQDWIPVIPAAHYSCGGIATDVEGKTGVENLYVLGEAACTGFHGANRLGSNSLLEATIMSIELAKLLSIGLKSSSSEYAMEAPHLVSYSSHQGMAKKYLNEIREIMQVYCSIIKTTTGLKVAAKKLHKINDDIHNYFPSQSYDSVSLQLSFYTANLIVESSLRATENRGAFYNEDLLTFPKQSPFVGDPSKHLL